MINFENTSLANAVKIYLVANTPTFIVRKLRADSFVIKLARNETTDDLYKTLQQRLNLKPNDLDEVVIPFVLVAALAQQQAIEQLRSLRSTGRYRWLAEVISIFAAETKVNKIVTVNTQPSAVVRVDTQPSAVVRVDTNPKPGGTSYTTFHQKVSG